MHWSFGQLSLIWDLQVTLCPHTRPLTLWGLWSETEGLLLVIRQPVTGHAQSIMVLLHYVSKYTQAHSSFPLCHPCNPYTLKGQGSQKTQKQIKTCNMMFHLKPNKPCFFVLNNIGECNNNLTAFGNDGSSAGVGGGSRGSDVWTASTRMSTEELIFQKRFPLSLSINTLIAKGIAKHKMNVRGWRNNKKGQEERRWKYLGQQTSNTELLKALQEVSPWYINVLSFK